MLSTGLVSVTFRKLSPDRIIEAARQVGLQGIEWGGDVHVPAGDTETARRVAAMTRDAGLQVFAYGSYYRIGCAQNPQKEFAGVLAAASALGAPVIRVWGYDKGSADIDAEVFERLAQEARMLCDMAAEKGIGLSLECHNGTITDDWHSALRFLERVGRPNLQMYWQPNQFRSEAYNLEALRALGPVLTHVHVFHWVGREHFPLSEGAAVWNRYLDEIRRLGGDHALELEFMHDDAPGSLPEAARTLHGWIDRD